MTFGSPSSAQLLPHLKKTLWRRQQQQQQHHHQPLAPLQRFRHEDVHVDYDVDLEAPAALLGTGASSRVMLAHTAAPTLAGPPGTPVAIKQVPRTHRGLATNELAMLQRCAGPYVPTVFDACRHGAHMFLVMEACEGEDLFRHMQRVALAGRLTEPYVRDLAYQMGSILAWLHSQAQIMHRDLKLENFMVIPQPNGSVHLKVIDFGFASAIAQPKEQGYGTYP